MAAGVDDLDGSSYGMDSSGKGNKKLLPCRVLGRDRTENWEKEYRYVHIRLYSCWALCRGNYGGPFPDSLLKLPIIKTLAGGL